MDHVNDWALIVPMANESPDLAPFIASLTIQLDHLRSGRVYLIVDTVSTDDTLALCEALSATDPRFRTIWAPENRHVVDAYIRGYREAYDRGHALILEMDAGLSHDPASLPSFLALLQEGHECVFGSRFVTGGSIADSTWRRKALSWGGTLLSELLLGTRMSDMTSGYQGFQRQVVGRFLSYPLRSTGHFYQTELRYLLRNTRYWEVPIRYRAPSPNVSGRSIRNSLFVLLHYTWKRVLCKAPSV